MNKEEIIEVVKELSAKLDAGDTSTIETVAAKLINEVSAEMLPIIKEHLGIDRIVKHNLDDNEQFFAVLRAVAAFAAP